VRGRDYEWLFVCNLTLIEILSCSCAICILLTIRIACVQYAHYRLLLLLVCSGAVIDVLTCLCANFLLLNMPIACVQRCDYWAIVLLMCNIRSILLHFTRSGI